MKRIDQTDKDKSGRVNMKSWVTERKLT